MSKDPALIVMYHYVWPDHSPIPAGIRPLLLTEFETQLDWLGERYDIVGPEEFITRIADSPEYVAATPASPLGTANDPRRRRRRSYEDTQTVAKPACLLTFDDGTKDHAQIVTPLLAARALTGVFFVLSGPAEHGIMPTTHAIHWLLGGDDERLWKIFRQYGGDFLGDPADAQRIYHYETPLRARIKYAANMALPAATTEQIVQSAVVAAAGGR